MQRAWSNRGLGDFWQHCLVAEGASTSQPTARICRCGTTRPVQIIVEEAGGRCSTFGGSDPHPSGTFVSTNGVLHDEVVALLGAANPESDSSQTHV